MSYFKAIYDYSNLHISIKFVFEHDNLSFSIRIVKNNENLILVFIFSVKRDLLALVCNGRISWSEGRKKLQQPVVGRNFNFITFLYSLHVRYKTSARPQRGFIMRLVYNQTGRLIKFS